MKLKKLELHRSRGLDTGYTLAGLSPGFNVIVGSNGSGKSSICRAIAGLLWSTHDFPGSALGQWSVGEGTRSVLREGATAPIWNGAGTQSCPALPDDRFRGSFSFTVDDLLPDESTTEEIRRVIRTELLAGIDFSKMLGDGERIEACAASVAKQENEIVAAGHGAEQLSEQHGELLREEGRLQEQVDALQAARDAEARKDLHADALELADSRVSLGAAKALLGKFPAAMGNLRGDEKQLLEARRDELHLAESNLEQALAKAQRAGQDLQATKLDGPVPLEHLKVLGGHENSLRQLEASEKDASQREAVAVSALDSVRSRLPRGFELRNKTITRTGFEQIEKLLVELERLETRRVETEIRATARERTGDEPAPGAPIETAIGLLARWLADARGRGMPKVMPFIMMAAGIGFISLGFFGQSELLGTYMAGALLVVLGVFMRMFGGSDGREALVASYLELPLEPPLRWETQAVVRRLSELQEAGAVQQARRYEADAVRKSSHDLTLIAEQRSVLVKRLEEAGTACGVDPRVARLGLLEVARHLVRHAEALQEFEKARTLKDEARAALGRELAAANSVLKPYGFKSARNAEQVRAAADALKDREQQRASVTSQAHEVSSDIKRATRECTRRKTALKQFFEGLGIDTDGECDLLRQLDQLPEWKIARDSSEELQAEVERLERRLEQHPKLTKLDPQEARRAQQRNSDLCADSERLQEEVARTEHALDEARQGQAQIDARAEEQRCRESMAETHDMMLEVAAADGSLEAAGQEQQNLAQLDILSHAAQLFAQFTQHAYQLSPAADSGGGVPFEICESEGQAKLVEELSSGSRSQLGLALRLAVAQSVEQGESLPIVLDEALTNSDPERFREVVGSLNELVNAERQIFFFTADPKDATRLEHLLAELGAPPARHYDLDALRSEASAG